MSETLSDEPNTTAIWRAPHDPFGTPCTVIAVSSDVAHIAYQTLRDRWERVETLVPVAQLQSVAASS